MKTGDIAVFKEDFPLATFTIPKGSIGKIVGSSVTESTQYYRIIFSHEIMAVFLESFMTNYVIVDDHYLQDYSEWLLDSI